MPVWLFGLMALGFGAAFCAVGVHRYRAGRTFMAGSRYTIADISALVFTDLVARAKLAVPEECQNYRRWHATVLARPSASA